MKDKKKDFEKKAKKQDLKLLDKILQKIADGKELDEYDEENLEYFKEEGYYNA